MKARILKHIYSLISKMNNGQAVIVIDGKGVIFDSKLPITIGEQGHEGYVQIQKVPGAFHIVAVGAHGGGGESLEY